MSEIVIIHDKLAWGGGGAVFMNIAQSLQKDHELYLITARSKDIESLNKYYSTNVSTINVHEFSILELLERLKSFRTLGNSILSSLIGKLWSNKDLIINTTSDVSVRGKSISYIHGPYQLIEREIKRKRHKGISKYYFDLCNYIEPEEGQRTTYLANSKWTSKKVSNVLGEKPTVVYPPVYTEDIEPVKWDDRQDKIITVGRISPEKNVIRNIRIVEKVVRQGYDLEYHIVGPKQKNEKSYVKKVEQQVENLSFVHIEGKVGRQKLSKMISSFKWGLHGHDTEHFGITVAELVAGGAIPFVPNNGGQVEIVNHCKEIIYGSEEEAIDKITSVMTDKKIVKEVKSALPNVNNRFGVRRFRKKIRRIVDMTIDGG